MTHEFELTHEIGLDATPEQVWEAIATGPGFDAWFMGRTEIEPHVGGRASITMPGFTIGSTVTACQPPHHFAFRGDAADNGTFMAFEYLVEARDGGGTVLRFVHSGIMGDDWETEYDAVRKGNPLYLRTLAQYLDHFAGRVAVPVTAFGLPQPSQEQAWAAITSALGLTAPVHEGDKVHLTVGGEELDGVVDTLLEPTFLGVRTGDALLRFVGRGGMMLTGHHIFTAIDADAAHQAWSTWLASALA